MCFLYAVSKGSGGRSPPRKFCDSVGVSCTDIGMLYCYKGVPSGEAPQENFAILRVFFADFSVHKVDFLLSNDDVV